MQAKKSVFLFFIARSLCGFLLRKCVLDTSEIHRESTFTDHKNAFTLGCSTQNNLKCHILWRDCWMNAAINMRNLYVLLLTFFPYAAAASFWTPSWHATEQKLRDQTSAAKKINQRREKCCTKLILGKKIRVLDENILHHQIAAFESSRKNQEQFISKYIEYWYIIYIIMSNLIR